MAYLGIQILSGTGQAHRFALPLYWALNTFNDLSSK
jgi:hypothetical protein